MPTVQEFLKQYGGGAQSAADEQPKAEQAQPRQTSAVDQFMAKYGSPQYKAAEPQAAPVQTTQPQPSQAVNDFMAQYGSQGYRAAQAQAARTQAAQEAMSRYAPPEAQLAGLRSIPKVGGMIGSVVDQTTNSNALQMWDRLTDEEKANYLQWNDQWSAYHATPAGRMQNSLYGVIKRGQGGYQELAAHGKAGVGGGMGVAVGGLKGLLPYLVDPEKRSGDFGKQMILDMITGSANGINEVWNKEIQPAYDEAQKSYDIGQAYTKQSREGLGFLGKMGLDIMDTSTEMLFDRALDTIVPGAGLFNMGARSAGQGSIAMREMGANEAQALMLGLAKGGIEVLTEKISGFGSLRGEKGFIDSLVENGVERFVRKGGNRLIAKMLTGFGMEAGEEILSDVLNYALESTLKYNADGYDFLTPEWNWGDVLYDGLLGGILGALGGAFETPSANVKAAVKTDLDLRAMQIIGEQAEKGNYDEAVKLILDNEEFKRVFQEATEIKLKGKRAAQEAAIREALEEMHGGESIDADSELDKLLRDIRTKDSADRTFRDATEAVDRALAEHSSPGSLAVGTPSSAPAEQYVANLFGNVKTREDAIRAIETVRRSRSRLAYEQAFADLTGMELDDYEASLAEAPQNGAGAKEAPNRQITPGEGATASAQPSDEFNSGNRAVEERGLDFSEVDEAATNQARAQNAVLDAWNTQKTYSTTPSAAAAVDMIVGDQYNKMRGQTVRDSDLSRGAYIAQALRDSKYTGDSSFDEAVDLAREIVKDDWRNESRIMEGEGEWASMSPKMRAKVLNALQNGNEYYVRGNDVIKADSRLDLDKYTDERDVEGRYGEDLERAGVPNRTVTKEEARSDIGLDRMSDEDIERFIPRERAPDFRKDEDAPRARNMPQVSGKERAELETMAKREDARRHRINFEMWLQENNIDPHAPLVHDPRLGTPRVEIRDVTSQAVMRSKRLLTDLVRGENGFAGWPTSERLDLLRSIYPEANWSLSREPADQRAIEANKRQIAEWDAKFKEWRAEHNDDGQSEMRYRKENPRPKPVGSYVNTITLGQRGLSSNGRLFGERSFDWKIEKPKPTQTVKGETSESNKEQSSGRPVGTEGTTRRISQRALEQDVEELRKHGRVRDDADKGSDRAKPGSDRRGNEERNAGAAPVLKSEAEVKEWKEGVENAKKKGWKFIGNLTQAMAEVNKFLNKFGVPCTHCDTSTSTEYGNKRAGGFAGLRNIFLGWGGFSNTSVNCKAVHEVTHQKVAERYGKSDAAAKPCAKALLKSSASPDVLKGVVDNYRKADGEKYSKRDFGKTYSELDAKSKRDIDERVYAEIFSDACAKNFTYKMHDAGLTMSQLSELHELCMDQAEAFGIFTKEERGWIEDFLKKPLKDDYRLELENEKKRVESKNEAAREDDSFKREAQRKREAEFKNGEYTYVPSSGGSPKLRAGLNENRSVPERGPTSPIETDLNSKKSKDEGYKSADRTAENRERWLAEHPNSEYAKWKSQFSDVDESANREQIESRIEEIDQELYDLERQAEYEASQYENFSEQYAGEYDQRIEDLENERSYLQDQIKDLDSSEKSARKPSKSENPYLDMSLNEIEQRRYELDLLSEEAAYKSEVAYFEGGGKEYFDEQDRLLDEAEKAIDNDMYRNLRKQQGDYRLGEKSARKLARSEFEKDNLLNESKSGGIDVDAEDFERPPMTMREREERRAEDIKNYKSDSDGTPESAKEYASKPQRESRKLIDRVEYSEQRREREKVYEAEEAEYKAQSEEDEKAAKEREDADRLAEAKYAFGKSHENLTVIGKNLSDLVGTKRMQTTAKGDVHEAFTYREGGRDIEPVANAFNDMVNGKATFKDVVEAYRGLGKTGKDGKVNGYFFDGSFYRQLEGIMDDIESGDVTNKDGSFKPDFAKRVETAAKMMEHRFGFEQAKLTTRAEAGNAFTDPDKKVATGRKHDANNIFKRINLMQLRPSTAFRSFAGYAQKAGKAWYNLAEKSTDSVRRYINTYQTAQEYFRELTQHKDWKAFSQGKITVQNVVPGLKTGLKGNRLSANMALGYLKTLETEGAIDHIVDNGIVETARNEKEYWSGRANKGFGNKNGYSQMFDMVSEETRAEIESALASHDDYALNQARAKAEHELENVKKALKSEISKIEVAKKAYDASFKVMGYLKRCLNSTSRSVWGVDFAVQNKFYWPLAAGGDRAGGELLNGSSWGLNNARNIQMREGSRGGLKIEAFTDVMENYIRWASEWSSYQGISDELDILSRNYRDTKSITQLLQDNVGSHAVKWLNNYVADLNGTREGERMAWLGKMRGKVAQGSLLLNGSVALKQAPSGLDFMGILDADIVAKRFFTGSWRSARYFRNNELINTINQHTGMLTNRQMGYNIVEQGEAAEAMRKDAVDKFVQSLPGFMTNWITKTDYRTVANGMLACADQINRYIKDGKPGYEGMVKGSDAYNEAVADLFERAVIDTQPIYNKQYRADYLRTTNEFLRTLGMFRTQQTQNYNNLVESLGELAAAKREGSKSDINAARKRVRGTIGGQVSAAMVFSMLGTAAKLLLHKQKDYEDDEGKFDWNKVLQRTGFNALNSVISTSWLGSMISPFLIDRSTQLLSGLTGGKVVATNEYYATEDSVLGLINDVTDAAQNLINNPSPKTWKAMALSTAAATGLPLRNVYNMLNTVVMYSLDDPFKWLGLKGTNYKNEDDFMNIMNEWYAADSKKRGKITMERALSLRDNESYDLARMLLSTIDPQDKEAKSAIKSVLTNAFVTGQIDEKTYRDFVHNYAKVDIEDVNKLVDAANAKVEWEKAQTRATNGDAALAKEWDQQLGEYSGENDPDGSQRMNVIMDFGLDDEDTDAFVSHYLPKKFNTYYDALREGGFSPSRANRIIQAINFDDNTSISQDEMWASFTNDPSSEAYIELLWNASGYTGKNTKTWADYKRSKGR